MPRPKKEKRRGPRQERKRRQAEKAEQAEQEQRKRQKLENGEEDTSVADDEVLSAQPEGNKPMAFYGMLMREDLDYFTRAGEMLELNQFNSSDGMDYLYSNLHWTRY